MTDFVEPATGIFVEDAFRHLLSREALRATRYQDFFSVCLVQAGPAGGRAAARTSSRRSPGRSRSSSAPPTWSVGSRTVSPSSCCTPKATDAVKVAERLRAHIEQVAFLGDSGSPRQITLSVGGVSFPRDGYNDTILLSRAQAHVNEAARQGGNRVVHAAAESRG